MRVLIGCEFGAGRGHITFASNVTAALRKHFPDVVIETHVGWSQALNSADLHNPDLKRIPFFEEGYLNRENQIRQTWGFTLFETVTAGTDTWVSRLNYWHDVVQRFKPDVVLAEYAPGLSMYTRGRIPTVVTGTGYSLPPTDTKTFPIFLPQAPASKKCEDECIEILNVGLRMVGAKPLSALPEMNAGDFVGLVTLPIFDPYWQIRNELYLGAEIPGGAPSPRPAGPNVLAYFSNSKIKDEVWEGISTSGFPTEVYQLSEYPKKILHNISFRKKPFHLAEELPGTGLVVHVGGLGFAAAALHAGVPQLLLYDYDEHWVHANAVGLAQIGIAFPLKHVTSKNISNAIHRLLNEPHYKNYALALSERYKPFADAKPSLRIAREIGTMA